MQMRDLATLRTVPAAELVELRADFLAVGVDVEHTDVVLPAERIAVAREPFGADCRAAGRSAACYLRKPAGTPPFSKKARM